MTVETRRMTALDLDAVQSIDEECFSVPWSRAELEKDLTQNPAARYIVLLENGIVAAYAGAWMVLDEGQIMNVAVRKDKRRLGYGKRVLSALVQYGANLGMSCFTLEVRASNSGAIALYESIGFIRVGRRKGYYQDNKEDALLYCLPTLPKAEEGFCEAETVSV
ncbi:MAG: ribosomal protein S18-alanine N-acetyltransferase [Eubacteriales bacterium]|nr:ribosomal protein S18-alanine N-acetyltransferase [Eubacteriales bacterium]MDD3880881.1 ribosomal protein S18-alanine N-acetyltransferase [Eubacteriales bacterium]MDD4511752.1 ribosomal protein S18-alanine N-acetyltransferase [Eubacteriales bacterium]